jgi:hypothetical protein
VVQTDVGVDTYLNTKTPVFRIGREAREHRVRLEKKRNGMN